MTRALLPAPRPRLPSWPECLRGGHGERLELVHRATHRDIFARGALDAALRLARLGPGRHDFGALLLADSRR